GRTSTNGSGTGRSPRSRTSGRSPRSRRKGRRRGCRGPTAAGSRPEPRRTGRARRATGAGAPPPRGRWCARRAGRGPPRGSAGPRGGVVRAEVGADGGVGGGVGAGGGGDRPDQAPVTHHVGGDAAGEGVVGGDEAVGSIRRRPQADGRTVGPVPGGGQGRPAEV